MKVRFIKMKEQKEERPWGHYEILATSEGYQVKIITLKPKSAISFQYHLDRSEHWIVASGEGQAILGESEQELEISKGSYIHVTKRQPHRLVNTSEIELVIIEVQQGDYLGEDDIVRIKDYYGRN